MDEDKDLTKFVQALREEIPGAGVAAYRVTKSVIQICPEMPAKKKLTDERLSLCKQVAKTFSKAGRKISISIKRNEKDHDWRNPLDQAEIRAWSKNRERFELLKQEASFATSFEKTLQLLPGLADCYKDMQKPDLAELCLKQLEKFIDLDKHGDQESRAAQYWFLGHQYLELGLYEPARKANENAQKLNYGHREIQMLARDIKAAEEWKSNERKQLQKIFDNSTR